MVSKETLDIANDYYSRHKVGASEIGFVPFLRSGKWDLFLSPLAELFFAATSGGIHRDCLTVAMALRDDILEHHPQLAPVVLQFLKDRNTQNYVQITCPQSGEKINLDPTPWAYEMHTPYPSGVPARIDSEGLGVIFRYAHMIPHAISPSKKDILTTSISAWLPAADTSYFFQGADFVVIFSFSQQYSITDSVLSPWRLALVVEDIDCLVAAQPDRNDSIALSRKGVLRLGVFDPSKGYDRLELISPHRLDTLYDVYDERRVGVAAQSAIRDASAIFRKLKRRMPVLGFDKEVDVRKPLLNKMEVLFNYPKYLTLSQRPR